jgi:hypothetical protein
MERPANSGRLLLNSSVYKLKKKPVLGYLQNICNFFSNGLENVYTQILVAGKSAFIFSRIHNFSSIE